MRVPDPASPGSIAADAALRQNLPADPPCPDDVTAVLRSGVVVRFMGSSDGDPDVCVQHWNGRSYRYYLGFWGDGRFEHGTPNQRQALDLKKLRELQARARKCRALYLCNHVANASKHWSVEDKYHDPTIAAVVECSETGWVGYFLDGATKKPADQVFDAALEYWTHFIYDNGIAKGHGITDISADEA